jgi:hypothetical protein
MPESRDFCHSHRPSWRQNGNATVLGFPFGLNMNRNNCALHAGFQRMLDLIANRMGFVDRHGAGNDEMQIDESRFAGVPGPEIMRLNSARRIC